MTWRSTWPGPNNVPHYAEHDTEAAAVAHAREIERSGRARVATCYEIDDEGMSA